MKKHIADYAYGLEMQALADLMVCIRSGKVNESYYWAGSNLANMGETFNHKTLSYVEKVGSEQAVRNLQSFLMAAGDDLATKKGLSDYRLSFLRAVKIKQYPCIELRPKSNSTVQRYYLKFTFEFNGKPVIDFHD